MKRFNAIAIALSIVLAALVLGRAYTYKYRAQETVVVTGLAEREFTSDLIVWRGWIAAEARDAAEDALEAAESAAGAAGEIKAAAEASKAASESACLVATSANTRTFGQCDGKKHCNPLWRVGATPHQ